MREVKVPVLVVGGGPTGLSAALFLSWHGVRSMLVERRPGPSAHPRARALNPRTMEVYRSIGIEDTIRANPSFIFGNEGLIHADTLAGPELARMPTSSVEDVSRISPSHWMQIDQNQLEPLLQGLAVEAGLDVRPGTTLVGIKEGPDGVRATLEDRAEHRRYTVTADYLIAADGGRSPVRRMLGIGFHGIGTISHVVSIFFRADLTGPLRGRRPNAVYLNNPTVRGTIIPIDNKLRWLLNVGYRPADGERPEDFTDVRRIELVRAAIGDDELPVELENVFAQPWELSVQMADAMRRGRVFVAGDAAHAMPPTGAFGASTGIQDVHNLAWKLARVLDGAAGPALLDSYVAERYPIGEETVRQATLRFNIRDRENLAEIAMAMIPELPMVFGYRYRAGALVPEPDGDERITEDPRRPTGRPGTRAPHVELVRDGRRLSTLDLFGHRFVLLSGVDGTAWTAAAEAAGRRFGLPLDVHRIGVDAMDREDAWSQRYGVRGGGAVLVRPDGFVAWRTPDAVPDPEAVLVGALARILHRPVPA